MNASVFCLCGREGRRGKTKQCLSKSQTAVRPKYDCSEQLVLAPRGLSSTKFKLTIRDRFIKTETVGVMA